MDTLKQTIKRIESWVARQVANPAPVGHRNNQLIQVIPRMLETGMDEDAILEMWLEAYEGTDDEIGDEIRAVIRSAEKYVQPITKDNFEEFLANRQMRSELRIKAQRTLPGILEKYSWTWQEIQEAGGLQAMVPVEQTKAFLGSMFEDHEIVWCGQVWQTGDKKDRRTKAVIGTWAERFQPMNHWWYNVPRTEFISHCTFVPGSVSRCNESVMTRKYLVIESDVLTVDQIGAVFTWLWAERGLKLRAVVYSGGKSLHGWFDMPDNPPEQLAAILSGLDCDPACIRPSQPVRLAGRTRLDKAKTQTLLYLDES